MTSRLTLTKGTPVQTPKGGAEVTSDTGGQVIVRPYDNQPTHFEVWDKSQVKEVK